jgi:hypothetical protein
MIINIMTNFKDNLTIYKGFYIKNEQNKITIDQFYNSIQDDDKCYPLKSFWKKHGSSIDLPQMTLDTRQELLCSFINDDTMWKKFNAFIETEIVPHEKILELPEVQELIMKGETILFYNSDITIYLHPLKEFSYWLKLINKLFLSIIRELLEEIKCINTKIEKCILFKRIVEVSIQSLPLIKNKYAYNDLTFYRTQIEKIMCAFDDGLEFAFYAFAMLFPNLVNHDIHPILNTNSNTYNHQQLTVSISDPIFGNAKKQFLEFY